MNWNETVEDTQLIHEIAKRAIGLFNHSSITLLDFSMDITACHNSCPLRLKELLESNNHDFLHDISGIHNNINRDTGKLDNMFIPRYSK